MSVRRKTEIICVAGLIFLTASAHAVQSTRKMKIVFSKQCTDPPTRIFVIVNGNEKIQTEVTLNEKDASWTGEWPNPNPQATFDAASATASLRLRGRRTDCRKSYAEKDPNDPTQTERVALFTFDCDREPASDVNVDVEPDDLVVHYTRTLERVSEPCEETADIVGGKGTILDVRTKHEKLRMQIEGSPPAEPGVLLPLSEPLHLDKNRLPKLKSENRAKGDSGTPNLSSVALDLDSRNIEKTGFEYIDVARVK